MTLCQLFTTFYKDTCNFNLLVLHGFPNLVAVSDFYKKLLKADEAGLDMDKMQKMLSDDDIQEIANWTELKEIKKYINEIEKNNSCRIRKITDDWQITMDE